MFSAEYQNFDTMDYKSLAIVSDVLILSPHFEGQRLLICTDHDARRWIRNLADLIWWMVRWKVRISEFGFEVVHKAGIKNKVADELSQLEIDGAGKTLLNDDIPELLMSLVRHNDPQNDELDGSLADNYCVCKSRNVNICKLQNALTDMAKIVLARSLA